jgi:hypothetical protein
MILLWIILNLYACVSGVKDAVLYCKRSTESFSWNEHIIFFIERAIICSIPVISISISLEELIYSLSAFILSFSFFHNGFYYESRRRIDVNYYRWNSNSNSSTAKFEINFVLRSFLLILAVLILFTKLLINEL